MWRAFAPTVSATLLFQPGFEANQSPWFGQNLKQVKESALAHRTSTRAVLVLRRAPGDGFAKLEERRKR